MSALHRPNSAAEALRELQQVQGQALELSERLAEADRNLDRMRVLAEKAIAVRQELEDAHIALAIRLAEATAAYRGLVDLAQSQAVPAERTIQ